jgi:ketosteroid isomerase-like protein
MSEANVEIVRRCFGLWANRDFSALPEVAQPDLVLDVSRRVFNPAVYRGLDGFRRFVRDVDEIWEGFRFDPEELIDAGDHVVASARISGRGRGSGIETEMDEFSVWTVRDGKVSSIIGGFRDRADALEAVGLRE